MPILWTVPITKPCECEHIAHFADEKRKTPNGNPGHVYGQPFVETSLVNKGTPYGKFLVCKDCASDCLFDIC